MNPKHEADKVTMANASRIVSYVQHVPSGKWFFVSTIYRQSSAAMNNPPWYFETMTWVWDDEKRERTGSFIDQSSSYTIAGHYAVVESYYNTGEAPPEDEG